LVFFILGCGDEEGGESDAERARRGTRPSRLFLRMTIGERKQASRPKTPEFRPLSIARLWVRNRPPARARTRVSRPPTASSQRPPRHARRAKKNKRISPTGFDPVTCGLPIQLFNHYGPTTLPLSYGDRWHAFTRGKKPESYAKWGRIGKYDPLKKSGICISFALIALFVFFEEARFAFFGD